jgi:hypothetical protein
VREREKERDLRNGFRKGLGRDRDPCRVKATIEESENRFYFLFFIIVIF